VKTSDLKNHGLRNQASFANEQRKNRWKLANQIQANHICISFVQCVWSTSKLTGGNGFAKDSPHESFYSWDHVLGFPNLLKNVLDLIADRHRRRGSCIK
jgi:hypothetical protein